MSRSFATAVACLVALMATVPATAADFLLKANSGLAFNVPNPGNPLGDFSFKTVASGAAESEIVWEYDFTYIETGCYRDGEEPGCYDPSYWYEATQYGEGGDTAASTWQSDFIYTFTNGGSGYDGHLNFTNLGNFDVLLDLSFDATLVPSQAPVPEPMSWVMMLGGFGIIGGAMRRTKASVGLASAC